MSGSDVIRKHGLSLMMAAFFAVFLAIVFSHVAKAHVSVHHNQEVTVSHVEHGEHSGGHAAHKGHGTHHHGQHGTECPVHYACTCSGASLCTSPAQTAQAVRSEYLPILPEPEQISAADVLLAETAPPEPDRSDHLSVRRPPPSGDGWRALLYSSIPRLRL